MTIQFSEFQPNPPGTDPANVSFELSGTPGESFEGHIISIESDSGPTAGNRNRIAKHSLMPIGLLDRVEEDLKAQKEEAEREAAKARAKEDGKDGDAAVAAE